LNKKIVENVERITKYVNLLPLRIHSLQNNAPSHRSNRPDLAVFRAVSSGAYLHPMISKSADMQFAFFTRSFNS